MADTNPGSALDTRRIQLPPSTPTPTPTPTSLSALDALGRPGRHGFSESPSSQPVPPTIRLRSSSTPASRRPSLPKSPSSNCPQQPDGDGDSLICAAHPETSPLVSPPLDVSGQTPRAAASHAFIEEDLDECSTPVAVAVTVAVPDHQAPACPPPALAQRPHKSLRARRHRKNAVSVDSVPRQTIMKALASRPPPTSNMSIASSINGLLQSNRDREREQSQDPPTSRPGLPRKRLTGAIADLTLNPECLTASRITALASPCFFHKKFDAAVNIDKVLEEIREDDGMSHSRLLQTATGVREVSKQLQRRPVKIAVKNIMIVTKARDNQLVDLTRELTDWLLTTPRHGRDVGVNVYVDHKLRNSRRFDAASLLAKDERFSSMLRYWSPDMCLSMPEKFDLVLTLGGDGTVLYTSWLFQRIVPPILSFSLGSLGFMTNFEFSSYKEQLSRIMGDAGMRVNLRMRFTCTVYRANPCHDESDPESPAHLEAEQYEVLNELVIDRGPSPYVSNLELYGENELLTIVQADGCIFSTPTGSTAYSLSAGGSLVHPDIPAILLTPICPHTLSFRPMLLNDSMLLRVAVPRNSRATAYCAFDGKGRVELRQGDHVTIAASQYPFPTVLSRPTEWFDSLGRTLRWNTRGAQQKAWDGADEKGGAGEEKFDIDIDDEDPGRDSGYSAATSSAGNSSPVRRGSGLWAV